MVLTIGSDKKFEGCRLENQSSAHSFQKYYLYFVIPTVTIPYSQFIACHSEQHIVYDIFVRSAIISIPGVLV